MKIVFPKEHNIGYIFIRSFFKNILYTMNVTTNPSIEHINQYYCVPVKLKISVQFLHRDDQSNIFSLKPKQEEGHFTTHKFQ